MGQYTNPYECFSAWQLKAIYVISIICCVTFPSTPSPKQKDLRVKFLPTRWFEVILPLFCCIFPVLGDVVYFFVEGVGCVDFSVLSLLEFFSSEAMLGKRPEKCTFCGHWQINGNRNWWFPFTRNKSPPERTNTFQVGSCSSSLLQIGALSPPRMMSRTATAGLPQGTRAPPIFSVSQLIAIYFPDRWPGQTTLPRTTSSRSLEAGTQRPARWAESSTPNCSLWSRWPAPSIMVALRVVVPKVGRVGRRTVTVTSHQEGLLDSLLPHLVQQKGIFKVRSRTYSWYKLVLVFSEKCKSIWAPSQ